MGAVHLWILHKNVRGALCQQEIKCFIFKKKVEFVITVIGYAAVNVGCSNLTSDSGML